MCILFVAVNQHQDYPLIIAANRDEFFTRPTLASHFWSRIGETLEKTVKITKKSTDIADGTGKKPAENIETFRDFSPILAGKDQLAGGTWMGITGSGRLAALTNIRDPQRNLQNPVTRGELVSHYLLGHQHQGEYLTQLQNTRSEYNGYNLLFGPWHSLQVYNNHLDQVEQLGTGIYGLSNAHLNSPWPKINKGTRKLAEYCHNGHSIEPEKLFDLLKNREQAEDQYLPKTGVPIQWERRLSSIFITGEEYGTRSSTVLLVDKHQHVTWQERTFDQSAVCISQENHHFPIK